MKEALGTIAYVAPEARLHVGTEPMETKKTPNVGVFSWDFMGGTGIEHDIFGIFKQQCGYSGIKQPQQGYDRDTMGRLPHCQTIGHFPSKSTHRG